MAGSQKVRGSNPLTSTTAAPSPSPSAALGTDDTGLRRRPAQRAHIAPLLVLVFLAGIGSMATEISASRLLAPYYGSSTAVWAIIIGLILGSLSVGYWLGGRVAERRPDVRVLSFLVFGAAALVALIPFVARPLLELSVEGIATVSVGAVVGSFLASVALFAPPVILLGTVTPFAVRLTVTGAEGAGALAGRIFALSTLGSILGTVGPALVTIPLIGTQRTLLGAAVVLALAAAVPLGARWLLPGIVLAALLFVPPGAIKPRPGLVYEAESRYQFVQVVERGGVRRLYLNEGQAVHSVWRADTVLTGGEWDMFLTAPALLDRPPARAIMLGNAGGTTGRAFGRFFPATSYDGVELDPVVNDVAARFFGLADNPRQTVHAADARPFLARSEERYDLIFVDAYRQPYVPFYLATREFFALARRRLAPGGLIALNITTLPGDDRLARAVAGTLAWEFPQVVTWQALRYNQFVVGLDRPLPEDELRRRLRTARSELLPLTRLFARDMQSASRATRPWTDDRAPVEWITDRMIAAYALRGGDENETPLPTFPR